jgi:hypothetical protein
MNAVYIPKSNGKMRPLVLGPVLGPSSAAEEKEVEWWKAIIGSTLALTGRLNPTKPSFARDRYQSRTRR